MTNRVIKFRGIDKKRNEWVFGYFTQFGEQSFIIEYGKPGIPSQQIEVIPESVGQFTGLLDKNGVEIYEGDILEYNNPKYPLRKHPLFQIEFKFQGFNILLSNGENTGMGGVRAHPERFCVIGNVHQSPELLK